jgi:DNA-binding MarR family transcriptional regulator
VTVHTASSERIAASLRDVIARLNRRLRQTRPLGELIQTRLSALTSLDLAGALTPRELAEAERVQPPTMTRIVGRLADLGLVERVPHPTDGRQVILCLFDLRRPKVQAPGRLSTTRSGRAVLAKNGRARDAWLGRQIVALDTDERETLWRAVRIVDRIARA